MKIISYYVTDRITSLPQPIIETILCLSTIKEAVRMSILSRSWRYNWTKIPKLVFDERDMFDVFAGEYYLLKRKTLAAIHQALSMYEGSIHEFSLSMKGGDFMDKQIGEIITYLLKKNTIKKIRLEFEYYPMDSKGSVPSSFFSLNQLTDIYLCKCTFIPEPIFKGGFPSLTSLHLKTLRPSGKILRHFLSNSPVLKNFTLMIPPSFYFKHDDSISLSEICKNLAVIEHMSLSLSVYKATSEKVPEELPSALVHLKSLCLQMSCSEHGLLLLVLLIKSSPNLEKIKIEVRDGMLLATQLDYARIWLKQLYELEIENFAEYQLEFVKFILAKSPVLKKVRIMFHSSVWVHSVEGIEAMRILLQSPLASPVAELSFEHPIYDLHVFKSRYTTI